MTLEKQLQDFIYHARDKSTEEKKLMHYKTVVNITNRIKDAKHSKTNEFKKNLYDYFNELEDLNYTIEDKLTSAQIHKYLLPVIQFLIKKEDFKTPGDLHIFIFIGLTIDIILHFILFNYYYPIFLSIFTLLGIKRRIEAKKLILTQLCIGRKMIKQ